MLATDGLSRSTAHRELAGLEAAGHIARQERPEGGFLWRIGRRFRPFVSRSNSARKNDRLTEPDCRPGSKDAGPDKQENSPTFGMPNCADVGTPVPTDETPVPQRGTTDSRATPALKNLSSGSKEPSERELSLSQDEIPVGWEEAAAAERRLAGLGPVNLQREWRALLAHAEGARITIWRWRGWALKARGDRMPSADTRAMPSPETVDDVHSSPPGDCNIPGDDRQQRQARDWVRRGFWLRDGSWGPAPDQPGCSLPAALVAWCLRERAAAAA